MRYVTAFILSLSVVMWSVNVIAGYIADHVTSYMGPTPMALDTAICIFFLGVVGMILSKYRIKDHA